VTHTHTRWDSSGRRIGPSQRLLPDTTLTRDRHRCFGGIRPPILARERPQIQAYFFYGDKYLIYYSKLLGSYCYFLNSSVINMESMWASENTSNKFNVGLYRICTEVIQSGYNMTGTDLCVNKCKHSRSYLNHLVHSFQKWNTTTTIILTVV